MKSEFPEYYYEIEAMWSEAIFVFDANVLLNVYRFSPSASKDLLKIMNRLKDRIWIPYQFAAEYHRNSHTVMDDIERAYGDKKAELEKIHKKTLDAIDEFGSPTSFNVPKQQLNSIDGAFSKIREKLSEFETKHKDSLSKEDIRGQIAELFDGKVGKQTPLSEREKVYEEGKKRYEGRIPPGYKDKGRNKKNPYGDLVGWYEIIKFAKNDGDNAKPIILISDDSSSDDWFHKSGDEAKGPRRELVDEMREKTGVDFYLYETWQLLKQANNYLPDLKVQVPEKTIEEARHVSELRRQALEERRVQRRRQQNLRDRYISDAPPWVDIEESSGQGRTSNASNELGHDWIGSHSDQEELNSWDWSDLTDDGEHEPQQPRYRPTSVDDIPF